MVTKFVCTQSPSYFDCLFLLPKCKKKSLKYIHACMKLHVRGKQNFVATKGTIIFPTCFLAIRWNLQPDDRRVPPTWQWCVHLAWEKSEEFHRSKKSLCADWNRLPKSLSCRERAIKQSIFFTAPAVVFFYGIIIKNPNMIDFCYLHLTPYDDHYFVSSSALGHMIFSWVEHEMKTNSF